MAKIFELMKFLLPKWRLKNSIQKQQLYFRKATFARPKLNKNTLL